MKTIVYFLFHFMWALMAATWQYVGDLLFGFMAKNRLVLFAVDNLPIANATTASIRSLHDFEFKPSIMDMLYKNFGMGFTMIDFFRKAAGRSLMVSNETLKHQEQNFYHRTITLGDDITGGAAPGASATFPLDADDLDADDHYYPRIGFTTMFGDVTTGFIQCRITDITAVGPAVTIEVTPYDATAQLDTLGALVEAGAEVAIMDSAFAVETGQPAPTSVGTLEREHYAQICKETITFGGMELAKQKWVNVQGVGLFNAELSRAEFLLDLQEEMACFMGQINTNDITQASLIDGVANPVYKNKGVWTWVDELGGELTYTDAAGFTVDDLDECADYLESVGITDDIIYFGMGGKLMRRVENKAVEYIIATGNLPETFTKVDNNVFGGQPGMTLDIGFQAIKKGGLLFLLSKIPVFSNPYLLGVNDYKLNDAGIMFPVSRAKDPKSGLMLPNLYAGYVGIEGYSRKRIVATLGGMDGFAQQRFGLPIITQVDGNNTYWLSHVMFPFMEAFKGLIVRRSD